MTSLSSALCFPSFAGFIIFITLAVCLSDFPETEAVLDLEVGKFDDVESDGYGYGDDDYEHSNIKRNENEKEEKTDKNSGDSKAEEKGTKTAGDVKLNDDKTNSGMEETKAKIDSSVKTSEQKVQDSEKSKETSAVKEANAKNENEPAAKVESKIADSSEKVGKSEKAEAVDKENKAGFDKKTSETALKKDETGNLRQQEKEDVKVAEEKGNVKEPAKVAAKETEMSRFKPESAKKSALKEEAEEEYSSYDPKEPLRLNLPVVGLKDTDYHKNYLKSLNRINNRNPTGENTAIQDDSELGQLILKSIMNAYGERSERSKRKNARKMQTKRSETGFPFVNRQRKSPKTLEFKIQIIDQNEVKSKNAFARSVDYRKRFNNKEKRNEEIVYAPSSKSSFDEKEEPRTLVLVKKKQNGEKVTKTFVDGSFSKCLEQDLSSDDLAKLLSQKKDYVVLKKVPSSNEYKVFGESDDEDKAQAEETVPRPERKQKMKFVSAEEEYSNAYDDGEVAKIHTKGFKSVDKKLHSQEEPTGLGDFFKDEKKDGKSEDPDCQSNNQAEKEIVYLDEKTKQKEKEEEQQKTDEKETQANIAKQNREKAQRLQNENQGKDVVVLDRGQKHGKARFMGPQINGHYPQKYLVLDDGLKPKHQLKIINNDGMIPNDRIYELDRQIQKSHHQVPKNRYYGNQPVYAVVRPVGGKKTKENKKRNSDVKDFFTDNEISGNFNKFLKDFQELTKSTSDGRTSRQNVPVTKDQIREIKSYGDESLKNINELLKDLLNEEKEKEEYEEKPNEKNKRSYILPAETEETVLENQIQQILRNLKSKKNRRKKRDVENVFNNSTSRKLLSFRENVDSTILELFGKTARKSEKRNIQHKREIDIDESLPNHLNDLLETSFIGTGNEKREVVKKDEPIWEFNDNPDRNQDGGNLESVVEKRDVFDDDVNFYDSEMMSNDWEKNKDRFFAENKFRRRKESPNKGYSTRKSDDVKKKSSEKNEQFTMDKKTFEDMVKKYLESGSGTVTVNQNDASSNSDVIYQSFPQPTYSKTIDFFRDNQNNKGKETKTKMGDQNSKQTDVKITFQIPGSKTGLRVNPSSFRNEDNSDATKSFNLKEIGKKLQELLDMKKGYFQKGLEASMVKFEEPESEKHSDEQEAEDDQGGEDEILEPNRKSQYLYLKNRQNQEFEIDDDNENKKQFKQRGIQKKFQGRRNAFKSGEQKDKDDEDDLGDDVIQNVIGGYILRKSAKIHPEGSLNFDRLTEDGKSKKNLAAKKIRKRLSPGHLTESHFRKLHRKNNANKREVRTKRYQRNGSLAKVAKSGNNIRITITSEDEDSGKESRRKRFDFAKDAEGFERVVSDPKSTGRQAWRSADALSGQSRKESEGPFKIDLNEIPTSREKPERFRHKPQTEGKTDEGTYVLVGKKKRSVDGTKNQESPSREVSNHLYKLPITNRALHVERESDVARKSAIVTKNRSNLNDKREETTCPCPDTSLKIPQPPKDERDPSSEDSARKTGEQIVDCIFSIVDSNPKFKETIGPGLCGKREKMPKKESTCPAPKKNFEEKICPVLKKLKADLVKIEEEDTKQPTCTKLDKYLNKFLRSLVEKSEGSCPTEPFHDQNKFRLGALLENTCKLESKSKTPENIKSEVAISDQSRKLQVGDGTRSKVAPLQDTGKSKIVPWGNVGRYRIASSKNMDRANMFPSSEVVRLPNSGNLDTAALTKKRCYLLKLIEDYRRLSLPDKNKAEPLYRFLISRLSDTNRALGLQADDATSQVLSCRYFKNSFKSKPASTIKGEDTSRNVASVHPLKSENRAAIERPSSAKDGKSSQKLKSTDQTKKISSEINRESDKLQAPVHPNRKLHHEQRTHAEKELHKLGLGDAAALQLALGQKPWFSNLDVTKGVPNFIPLSQKSAGNSRLDYKRPQLSQSKTDG